MATIRGVLTEGDSPSLGEDLRSSSAEPVCVVKTNLCINQVLVPLKVMSFRCLHLTQRICDRIPMQLAPLGTL